MNYRKLVNEEISILKEFTYLSLYVPKGEPPFSKDILEKEEIKIYYEDYELDSQLAIVAEEHGEIIGCLWGHFWNEEKKGYGYFQNDFMEISLAVKKDFRGQGVGQKLLNLFIQEAKFNGVIGLSLSVSYDNFAIDLYTKAGFTIVSKRETDILMTCLL